MLPNAPRQYSLLRRRLTSEVPHLSGNLLIGLAFPRPRHPPHSPKQFRPFFSTIRRLKIALGSGFSRSNPLNPKRTLQCPVQRPSATSATSESSPTSTPARRRPPSASF